MVAIFTLLSVVAISIVVIRVATRAFMLTGMSAEAARFQAYSAFTGTGFTTREAEAVTQHPVRRRIAIVLMLIREAGLVTAVSSLVLSFVGTASHQEALRRGALLLGGLAALALLAHSRWVDRYLSRLIERALKKYAKLDVGDYYPLLDIGGDYTVARFVVHEGTWLAEKKLSEAELPEEGVLVLGILRADGTYLGAPRGHYTVHAGDTVVVYGKGPALEELDRRLAGAPGERAHARAVREHELELRDQDVQDGVLEAMRRLHDADRDGPTPGD